MCSLVGETTDRKKRPKLKGSNDKGKCFDLYGKLAPMEPSIGNDRLKDK
jgi:hypothetical protein